MFLYKQVLNISFGDEKIQALRAKKKQRVPIVLSRSEVEQLINHMDGTYQLMAKILYGCGLRILECMRLRVQNLDFENSEIHLINTKGHQDRITFLPKAIQEDLKTHLESRKMLYRQDFEKGQAEVYLPKALDRKWKNAKFEWRWQYVFPSRSISCDPRSGICRRHHLHESTLGKELKKALKSSGIIKRATAHTFRHYVEPDIMGSVA